MHTIVLSVGGVEHVFLPRGDRRGYTKENLELKLCYFQLYFPIFSWKYNLTDHINKPFGDN